MDDLKDTLLPLLDPDIALAVLGMIVAFFVVVRLILRWRAERQGIGPVRSDYASKDRRDRNYWRRTPTPKKKQ